MRNITFSLFSIEIRSSILDSYQIVPTNPSKKIHNYIFTVLKKKIIPYYCKHSIDMNCSITLFNFLTPLYNYCGENINFLFLGPLAPPLGMVMQNRMSSSRNISSKNTKIIWYFITYARRTLFILLQSGVEFRNKRYGMKIIIFIVYLAIFIVLYEYSLKVKNCKWRIIIITMVTC